MGRQLHKQIDKAIFKGQSTQSREVTQRIQNGVEEMYTARVRGGRRPSHPRSDGSDIFSSLPYFILKERIVFPYGKLSLLSLREQTDVITFLTLVEFLYDFMKAAFSNCGGTLS